MFAYIRHIFLYDILNDTTDDLELDFKKPFDVRQNDAIKLLNFWFKSGKIKGKELNKFCEEFNSVFSNRENVKYEIQILNGANKLRNFLIKKYSEYENFDKQKLCDICSKDLFAGRFLKDFLDMFFS